MIYSSLCFRSGCERAEVDVSLVQNVVIKLGKSALCDGACLGPWQFKNGGFELHLRLTLYKTNVLRDILKLIQPCTIRFVSF